MTVRPIIVPKYGMMFNTPRVSPMRRPNFSPMRVKPKANKDPMIKPMSNWPRKNDTMIEINSSSVQELHKLFGKDANISNADFLDNKKKWEKDLGQTQFDIVVGNPPFQVSKSNKYEGGV